MSKTEFILGDYKLVYIPETEFDYPHYKVLTLDNQETDGKIDTNINNYLSTCPSYEFKEWEDVDDPEVFFIGLNSLFQLDDHYFSPLPECFDDDDKDFVRLLSIQIEITKIVIDIAKFNEWAESGDYGSVSPCGDYVKFRSSNGGGEIIKYDNTVVHFENVDYIMNNSGEWVEFDENSFIGY